jgi:hypothetical protein
MGKPARTTRLRQGSRGGRLAQAAAKHEIPDFTPTVARSVVFSTDGPDKLFRESPDADFCQPYNELDGGVDTCDSTGHELPAEHVDPADGDPRHAWALVLRTQPRDHRRSAFSGAATAA